MALRYQQQQSMSPTGGQKTLSSMISRQLAYARKDTKDYDDVEKRYGNKVLNTSPERTAHNKPNTGKKMSPSPTGRMAAAGGQTMFT